MKYRNFKIKKIEYYEEDKNYYGLAYRNKDFVTFIATSFKNLIKEFKKSVDDYYIFTEAKIDIDPVSLAVLFHDTYERLAPNYGYETRKETRAFDPANPNGLLMITTAEHILIELNRRIK